jgi:hypothetical protein
MRFFDRLCFTFAASVLLLGFTIAIQRLAHWSLPELNTGLIFTLLAIQILLGLCTALYFFKSSLIEKFVIVGVCSASLSAVALFIVRSTSLHSEVSWNVDWRNALSSANSYTIDATGASQLDYFGSSDGYHSGASLLAGHYAQTTGFEPDLVLFFVVPLSALTSICLLGIQIARRFSSLAKCRLQVLLPALFIPYPGLTFSPNKEEFRFLISSFLINHELMINSMFGIATVCCGLFMILHRKKVQEIHLSACISLIALIYIKPQYIPMAALLFIVLFIIVFPKNVLWSHLLVVISFGLLPSALISYRQNSKLALDWDFAADSISSTTWAGIILIVLLSTFVAINRAGNERYLDSREQPILLFLAFSIFLVVLSNFLVFRIDSQEYLSVRNLAGGNLDATSIDRDIKQGFILLFISCLLISGVLCVSLTKSNSGMMRLVVLALVPVLLVKVIATCVLVLKPIHGYEYVDLKFLNQILIEVPDNSMVLVNDMNDPAEDFRRPGRGEYWSSLGMDRFFFSSIVPNATSDDGAVTRFRMLQTFFSTIPNSQQIDLLKRLGVESVVINLRCLPYWYGRIAPHYWNKEFAFYMLSDFDDIYQNHFPVHRPQKQTLVRGKGQCI